MRLVGVGARVVLLVVVASCVAVFSTAGTAEAKKDPFAGYSLTISFDGSKASATERVTRGSCGGVDRTLSQNSSMSGSIAMSNVGSGLFSKPRGSLAEATSTGDTGAGCTSENGVDTPRAATCTTNIKAKLTPTNASGFAGVGFQKSGGSYIVRTIVPQFGASVKTTCSPSDLSADAVGPFLYGFGPALQGRISANQIAKHKNVTTTLLPVTTTGADYDKYMCGTPDAETICEADYHGKAVVVMKFHD